ncbi:hypothetical protein PSP6_490072 [Paraburkholderia tropica]|nr:hypothetical protein PSP6_490072 [Paraburkholderia tropica]
MSARIHSFDYLFSEKAEKKVKFVRLMIIDELHFISFASRIRGTINTYEKCRCKLRPFLSRICRAFAVFIL